MNIVMFEGHDLVDEMRRVRSILAKVVAGGLHTLRYAVDSDGHKFKLNEGMWTPGYGDVQLGWMPRAAGCPVTVRFEGRDLADEVGRLGYLLAKWDMDGLWRLRYAVDVDGHKLKLNEAVWSPGYGQVQR